MSINKVVISGNLTRDVELKATQSGTSILRLGVAVNERVRQADGSWGDRANFVDCVVFGNRADALAKFLSKGAKVAIEGHLRYSSWEKDGQRRSKLEVIVDELEMMQRRQDGASGQYQQQPSPSPAPVASVPPAAAPAPQQAAIAYDVTQSDADIPF